MFEHEYQINSGKHSHNPFLERRIRKIRRLGLSIQYKKIFESENERECLHVEQGIIKAIGRENLCNLTDGGESFAPMRGKKHSPESIEKMRLARVGRKLSEEHKQKIGLSSRGRKWSNESREKARKSAKIRASRNPISKHEYERRSILRVLTRKSSGIPWHSEDSKQKISKSNTGKKLSIERVKQLRQLFLKTGRDRAKKAWITRHKNKSYGWSEDRRSKMSERMKGNKFWSGVKLL